eukprot:5803209-Pleurochrysis_carterae.AAC.4
MSSAVEANAGEEPLTAELGTYRRARSHLRRASAHLPCKNCTRSCAPSAKKLGCEACVHRRALRERSSRYRYLWLRPFADSARF